MFRVAPRLIARPAARAGLSRTIALARRHLSTAPPTQKSRSWKSLAARVGIAGTLIYYYNTTDVFAEEPNYAVQALPETDVESEHLQTIEAISAERQKRKAVQAQLYAQAQREAQSKQEDGTLGSGAEGNIGDLEEEADQQGAFNPETGEINWDCPCLGGMAHGPCGEEFKAAFSCFVFSKEEPKGMDCIDKFSGMQNCFRKYPEVYGEELEAGDEDAEAADVSPSDLPSPSDGDENLTATQSQQSQSQIPAAAAKPPAHGGETGRAEKAKQSGESSSKPVEEDKSTTASPKTKTRSSLSLVPDNYKPESKPVSESEE